MSFNGQKPKTCKEFKKTGSCKFGKGCKNLHNIKDNVSNLMDNSIVEIYEIRLKEKQCEIDKYKDEIYYNKYAKISQVNSQALEIRLLQSNLASLKVSHREQMNELQARLSNVISNHQEEIKEVVKNSSVVNNKEVVIEVFKDIKENILNENEIPQTEFNQVTTVEWMVEVDSMYYLSQFQLQRYDKMTSDEIEKCFQKYSLENDAKLSTLDIHMRNADYEINVATMYQKRTNTGKLRKIVRKEETSVKPNDKFIYSIDKCFTKNTMHAARLLHSIDTSKSHQHSIPLISVSDEYREIELAFHKTISRDSYKIVSIDKNIHPQNAAMYETTRAFIPNKSERMLWHGYRNANLDLILSEGLDMKMSQRGLLGKGIYLSADANYSDREYVVYDAKSTFRQLLYVKSLVGCSHNVTSDNHSAKDFLKPPLVSIGKSDRYNSVNMLVQQLGCADQTHIYCIYDNPQTYVAYIVKYIEISKPSFINYVT